MANDNDWLGGYTLQELLGAPPVSKSKKQLKQEKKSANKAAGKRGVVNKTVGAPFRLSAALLKLPVTVATKIAGGLAGAVAEIVRLPVRLVTAIASPWRKKQ